MGKSSKIILLGYYGYGNAGDEAILETLLVWIREADTSIEPAVVTGDVTRTRDRHAVEAIPAKDVAAVAAAVSDARLLIIGGGGLIHDYWGYDPATVLSTIHWGLSELTGAAFVAASLDVPVLMAGIGVGPVTGSRRGRRYGASRHLQAASRCVTTTPAGSCSASAYPASGSLWWPTRWRRRLSMGQNAGGPGTGRRLLSSSGRGSSRGTPAGWMQ